MRITSSFRRHLERIVGSDGIVTSPSELKVYECDGYTLERARPELVVLPRSTAEVSAVVSACAREGMPFVPRGAGTGVSGGCLPVGIPVMIDSIEDTGGCSKRCWRLKTRSCRTS